MDRRTYSYLLLFFTFPVSADVPHSQHDVIPPVIIKAPQHLNHSFSSGPTFTITHEQLSASGADTLAQALQTLGGVQLQDTTGNGSQVMLSMRGFGANASSNTLLLVNGIPITNPDIAPPDLNAIPLYAIESIEIVSGSESVLYGDQAVGGIINLVTRKQTKEIFTLACDAGSYNAHRCYATLNHHIKLLNYQITASNQHTDNYRDHNDYDQNILLGSFDISNPSNHLRFDYQIANEDMQYPGALTATQVQQNRRQANNNTDFFTDWNDFFHLQYGQTILSDWHVAANLVRREMHGHGVLFSSFTQSRTMNFIRPQISGTWSHVKIKSGLDLQDDNYNLNSFYGPTRADEQKYGWFGIANIPVFTHSEFSLGARTAEQFTRLETLSTAHNDNLNRALALTAGVRYQVSPDLSLYLRRAGSFRFPKADENASTPPGINGLRTQRGAAYETGMEWKHDNYVGKIGIYQLNLRDEIQFDPLQTPQSPFGSNTNLAPTVRRGLTISGNSPLFTDRLTLDGQYNYVNACFQSGTYAGNRIPLVSENILHGGLNYRFTDHWAAYTEAVFTGNQFAANDNANVAGKIGGYTVYNFNLRFTYKQLTASFRMNNIFNKNYYYYTVYQPSMQTEFFYPAPDRSFMLTVRYSFL